MHNGEGINRDIGQDDMDVDQIFTKGLEKLLSTAASPKEVQHRRDAIDIAKKAQIFENNENKWDISHNKLSNATGDDLHRLLTWKTQR
jgi:hypothetical protein